MYYGALKWSFHSSSEEQCCMRFTQACLSKMCCEKQEMWTLKSSCQRKHCLALMEALPTTESNILEVSCQQSLVLMHSCIWEAEFIRTTAKLSRNHFLHRPGWEQSGGMQCYHSTYAQTQRCQQKKQKSLWWLMFEQPKNQLWPDCRSLSRSHSCCPINWPFISIRIRQTTSTTYGKLKG